MKYRCNTLVALYGAETAVHAACSLVDRAVYVNPSFGFKVAAERVSVGD